MSELQTFECQLDGDAMRYTRQTREQAMSAFKAFLDDVDWPYSPDEIVCKPLGFVENTPDSFIRTAKYRGVPFARIGMRVAVGDKVGWIVGKNSSANFDVLFRDEGIVLNCHPNWMIKYFSETGALIAEFKDGREATP